MEKGSKRVFQKAEQRLMKTSEDCQSLFVSFRTSTLATLSQC